MSCFSWSMNEVNLVDAWGRMGPYEWLKVEQQEGKEEDARGQWDLSMQLRGAK